MTVKHAHLQFPQLQVIDNWFCKLETFLKECDLLDMPDLGSRLWNADETGFCTAAAGQRVLARRGSREVHETAGGSGRDYVTVLGAGSADGVRLAPYILYKGVNLYLRWTEGGPAGAMYGVSKSGWMESDNFIAWFTKLFIPAVDHLLCTGPVVLFVDGHQSHLSLQLIHTAKEKGVHLYCLPPHTTHVLQPLDVGVYGPLKQAWKTILKQHKTHTMAAKVTKEVFPGKYTLTIIMIKVNIKLFHVNIGLINQLWTDAFPSAHLKSGFRASGLYPLNRHAIPAARLAPSIPFVSGPDPSLSSHPIQPPPSESTTVSAPTPSPTTTPADLPTLQDLKCHDCGNSITPVRLHVVAYFTHHLQKQNKSKAKDNQRVKPRYYGEALTRDEIVQRLEENEKQKREKAKGGQKRKKQPAAVVENTPNTIGR